MKNIALLLLFLPVFVHAENSAEISNVDLKLMLDSVWVVLCGVLVFFMQAGFALIESGTVRSKNTVNVLMKNYIDACVGGLVFWLIGFGLMFGRCCSSK